MFTGGLHMFLKHHGYKQVQYGKTFCLDPNWMMKDIKKHFKGLH